MPDRNNDMVPCANPECGHRKIHHHPRAGVCMASDRGEFCPCDEYEYPLEPVVPRCGYVACVAPLVERWMEMARCTEGHWTRLPSPEPIAPDDLEPAPGPFTRALNHEMEVLQRKVTWVGPMTESRFDALAREAATEEERCICGFTREWHARHGAGACPTFRPDPYAADAVKFVHDAVDAAFEKRRRNLLAADKRNPE